MDLQATEPAAQELTQAIQSGDLERLQQLLDSGASLAAARIVDRQGVRRTLLHLAVDWPGRFPRVQATIRLLIGRGADPDQPLFGGNAPEAALHGAASCNDVEAIDALLDGGANIESSGAIFTNGTAMSDAVIFAQWDAAHRLLERGAKTTLTESAALGLMTRLTSYFDQEPKPEPGQVTAALWHACRGGQMPAVQYLLKHGANLNWIGWDKLTPLDAALRSGNGDLAAWLQSEGAKRAAELAE